MQRCDDCHQLLTESFELVPVIANDVRMTLCKFCRPGSTRWAEKHPNYVHAGSQMQAQSPMAGMSVNETSIVKEVRQEETRALVIEMPKPRVG